MNYFSRAIKNVTRKLSKTILLIITFFVIGNFVIIGLSVAKASDSAKILTRQKMRAVATYDIDWNRFYNDADQIEDEDERQEFYNNSPTITLSDIKEVIKDERVKTANAITNTMFYSTNNGLDYVHLGNKAEENMANEENQVCEEGEFCEVYINPNFFAKGNFVPNMIEFADGDYEVLEGNFYSQEDIDNSNKVCLVSEALANLNNIKVGDTISFNLSSLSSYDRESGLTEEDVLVELQVIGIYSHNIPITPSSSNYDYTYPYENPDNMILIPGTTLYNIQVPMQQKMFDYYKEQYPDEEYYQDESNRPVAESIDKITVYNTTLLLNDPLEVENFVEDYKDRVSGYKKISVNNEEFNKLSKPLDTLSDYAEFIVILVLINAVVIITLVTALTLKTREYEIGVLLSIGASKLKVVLQFFVELALVALIGFTLAVGSGSIISRKVGYDLLQNQIESSGINEENEDYIDYEYTSIWDNNYETKIELEDIVAEYDVTVSPLIIGEIYVVGLGIVLISVIIPSIMIMRFNPKKILMNQG